MRPVILSARGVAVIMLAACPVAFSQQIPCPVASDYTNSASAFNAQASCSIQTGATLANASGASLLNRGGAGLANNGVLQNAAGGTLINSGEIDNNSTGTLANAGTFTNNAGATIENSSTLTVYAFENQSGGTIANAGSIGNSGYLSNDSGATISNVSGGSFVNSGAVFNNGRLDDQAGATITNSDDIQNGSGATLTIQSGGTLANQTYNSVLYNAGTATNDGLIENKGTIENQPGAQLINGASGTIVLTNGGIFVDPGAAMINEGSMSLNYEAGPFSLATIANFGSLLNGTGATLTVGILGAIDNSDIATNNGNLVLSGTVTNENVDSVFTNNGTIGGDTGVIENRGVFTNNGTIAAPSTSIGFFDITNDGELNNNGAMTIGNVGFGRLTNDSELDNNAGATLEIAGNGTVTNTGSIVNAVGGTINNDDVISNQGLLENYGALNDNSPYFFNEGFGRLFNAGGAALVVSSAGVLSNDGVFNNAGLLTIDAGGELDNSASSAFTQTGGETRVDGTVNSVVAMQIQGGTLSGTGTINGNVANSGGSVRPGDGPGTLTINGNYTQGSAGTLSIDLFGDTPGEFGVLDVSGFATLDGTLDLVAEDGFSPDAGDDFTFLLFGSLSGDFSNIEFTNWTCPIGDTCSEVVGTNSLSFDIAGASTGGGGGGGTVTAPEPPTTTLFTLGLVVLFSFARRWRRTLAAPAAA